MLCSLLAYPEHHFAVIYGSLKLQLNTMQQLQTYHFPYPYGTNCFRLSVGIPTSNGLDRPQAAYYSHSALSHHHHQIVSINGNCQMAEVHSPTISNAAASVNQGSL